MSLSPEIIAAIDAHPYTYKDDESNQIRYKVIESLLANEKCTANALIRSFIDGCGKIEIGSEADKALTPIVELAKMYNCYHIEELRAIQHKPISQQLKEIWEDRTNVEINNVQPKNDMQCGVGKNNIE